MNKIDKNELQKFYIAYFSRPADPSGINYWLSRCYSHELLTLKQISNELSIQDEYLKNISDEQTIELQIHKLYLNLFDRKAEFQWLNYWLELVKKENYSISDILYDLLYKNQESKLINSKQLEDDLLILENKVLAANLFTEQISKSITLMDLYQPDSLSPWISGNTLMKATDFLRNISKQKVALKDIQNFINSIADISFDLLTKPAIEMTNISLSIPIFCLENRSLTKRITKRFKNITGGKLTESGNGTNIVALNNINLTIMKGERVALIGHNGSGKSSFLRLISGIYTPTNGQLRISVDVYPMLQKTFLTSPELSGIDACKSHYLLKNHSLEGFETFLNEIIDFSGLGSYISLPIKTYSEGMSARLIFSILTSSPHDCLAIDEGFGTGDADFTDRAEERMKKFMDSAATLLLASHSEELLKQFCNRGIVFSHGLIVYDGSLETALNYYHTHDYYNQNVIR